MSGAPRKIAVVLFNLGGPDKPESIAPFLKNFFMDPLILRVPYPARFVLSRLIAFRRSRKEAGASYGMLGGKSPLLANTQAQATALERVLNQAGDAQYRVFVAMRYWHPLSDETARAVKSFAPDHIVQMPLYPQFSTTTTESAFRAWDTACKKTGLSAPAARICCYPTDKGFIAQSAQLVRAAYDDTAQQAAAQGLPAPRILFSAHGLPKKIVEGGDPYQWQCEQSMRAIVKQAGLESADHAICYQSRVGPLEWIGPSTDAEIHRAGRDGVPLVIYPHAFVNDHVETLVEIGEEYRHLAQQVGVPLFTRVDTVATGAAFIGGLAGLVTGLTARQGVFAASGARICPHDFSACRLQASQQDKERRAA
jgi:ferrochelatase